MLKAVVNVVQELIDNGEINIGDKIIEETKIKLIDIMAMLYPNKHEVITEINRTFRDKFNV